MSYRIQHFDNYDQLPASYADLLDVAEREGLYSRRQWHESLMSHFFAKGFIMRLYTVEDGESGKPLLLMPMHLTRHDGAAPGAWTLGAISHRENYSAACVLVDPSAESDKAQLLTALFKWMSEVREGQLPPQVDVIRLVPFEADSSLGAMIQQSLTDAGFRVQNYANSYNQYEDCTGMRYEDYLASRSSNQRYNSRRRRRKLEKLGEVEFAMITGDTDPEAFRDAIDEYILVSVHSWKSRESTISKFILEWMQLAADQGYLRLGILRLNGRAVAAQFWVVSGGVANLVRTNFREDVRDAAPGVVLSNMIIEYLLDVDHVDFLDFGYGAEDYKGRWVHEGRSYFGIMAFNGGTLRGYYFGRKHILGQPLKRMVRRGRWALQMRGGI